jgi:hypothetical protein
VYVYVCMYILHGLAESVTLHRTTNDFGYAI